MKMMEMDFALRQLRIGYRKSPNNRTERTIMLKTAFRGKITYVKSLKISRIRKRLVPHMRNDQSAKEKYCRSLQTLQGFKQEYMLHLTAPGLLPAWIYCALRHCGSLGAGRTILYWPVWGTHGWSAKPPTGQFPAERKNLTGQCNN